MENVLPYNVKGLWYQCWIDVTTLLSPYWKGVYRPHIRLSLLIHYCIYNHDTIFFSLSLPQWWTWSHQYNIVFQYCSDVWSSITRQCGIVNFSTIMFIKSLYKVIRATSSIFYFLRTFSHKERFWGKNIRLHILYNTKEKFSYNLIYTYIIVSLIYDVVYK